MKKRGAKFGNLQRRYRLVPAGVRRVLYRKYTRKLYFIDASGVYVCAADSFDEAALVKKGYTRAKGTGKHQVVMERTLR
jgi:hypothetical protein